MLNFSRITKYFQNYIMFNYEKWIKTFQLNYIVIIKKSKIKLKHQQITDILTIKLMKNSNNINNIGKKKIDNKLIS